MSASTGENVTELEVDMTFTKELRAATKEVHKLSDVLVNAKFAFGKCGIIEYAAEYEILTIVLQLCPMIQCGMTVS